MTTKEVYLIQCDRKQTYVCMLQCSHYLRISNNDLTVIVNRNERSRPFFLTLINGDFTRLHFKFTANLDENQEYINEVNALDVNESYTIRYDKRNENRQLLLEDTGIALDKKYDVQGHFNSTDFTLEIRGEEDWLRGIQMLTPWDYSERCYRELIDEKFFAKERIIAESAVNDLEQGATRKELPKAQAAVMEEQCDEVDGFSDQVDCSSVGRLTTGKIFAKDRVRRVNWKIEGCKLSININFECR